MIAGREQYLAGVLASPPRVHGDTAPSGVWRTVTDLYKYLAETVQPHWRTAEVGLGVSTVLLNQWAAEHICIVPDQGEVDAVCRYITEHGHQIRTTFLVGSSDIILPSLQSPELNLVFIDGSHGWPYPTIDFHYLARHLFSGGIVVLDDMQIPGVRDFVGRYLELDPRWRELHRDTRWAAYERGEGITFQEEWTDQLFLGDVDMSRNVGDEE